MQPWGIMSDDKNDADADAVRGLKDDEGGDHVSCRMSRRSKARYELRSL
jgi:hypothetical protein